MVHVTGKVSVCCLDACGDLIVGDFTKQTQVDVLDGENIKHILKLYKEERLQDGGICVNCDVIYDRADALVYTSNKNMKVGMKAGFDSNAVDFF